MLCMTFGEPAINFVTVFKSDSNISFVDYCFDKHDKINDVQSMFRVHATHSLPLKFMSVIISKPLSLIVIVRLYVSIGAKEYSFPRHVFAGIPLNA